MSEAEKHKKINYLYDFNKWFSKLFGVQIYLMFGTLLGALREKDFIANDNDIDLAYISKYHKFEDVFEELLEINRVCNEMGLIRSFGEGKNSPRYCGHSHIFSKDKKCNFDVWTSWIGEDGLYYFYPIGLGMPRDIVLPLQLHELRHKKFYVHNKLQKMVEYLYSSDWKTPLNRKGGYYNKKRLEPLIHLYNKLKGTDYKDDISKLDL